MFYMLKQSVLKLLLGSWPKCSLGTGETFGGGAFLTFVCFCVFLSWTHVGHFVVQGWGWGWGVGIFQA